MVSRTDRTSAELETVRISKSPTTVVTANGEVPTKEEATVHIRELGLFVTVMLLEDTTAVLNRQKIDSTVRESPEPGFVDTGFAQHCRVQSVQRRVEAVLHQHCATRNTSSFARLLPRYNALIALCIGKRALNFAHAANACSLQKGIGS